LRVNANLVQQVPGAVVPAGTGPVTDFVKQHPDVYEVAVAITARQPGAAWAAGVDVSYTASGKAHTVRLLIGIAIAAISNTGSSATAGQLCHTAANSMGAAFASLQGS
jgi:hypothetical protein